ncbi:MAG TPA: GDSL-type esterase/lipase family protein, partial [Clostridia bacterium]|nr:GDSL-type esterase/lipase family protein [Clostridia bacterium]
EKSEVLAAVAYAENLACSPVVVAPYRIGQQDTATRVLRTFHIGNSLTDTVDGWLKPLAESGGHPLDFHRFTIPGAPTDWLWSHPASGFGDSRYGEAFFAFAPFGAIVTQPFAGHGRSIENEADHAGKFFELCRKHSPDVRLWIYQQWPDQSFGEGWSKGVIGLGGRKETWENKLRLRTGETLVDGGWQGMLLKSSKSPKTWQDAVSYHSRYFGILREELQRRYPGKPVGVIPAGPGLATLKTMMEAGKVPGMTDFFKELFSDGIHLTGKGRYFVSLVHYACLFGESPEGKVSKLNSGLTDDQARLFQQVAWQTVQACLASYAGAQKGSGSSETVAVEPPPPGNPSEDELPKGKPWVPGWCRWDWRSAWMGTHQGFVENTRKNQGKIDVVFYGDSITQGWGDGVKDYVRSISPALNVVNYGIGGDSTRQLLYRITTGEVDGITPKVVILKTGTNNLYDDANGGTDDEIAKAIQLVVQVLRSKLPDTRILLLGILPRQNDWFCQRVRHINSLIKASDDGNMVRFLDMGDAFYDSTSQDKDCRVKKGLFNKDLLHLEKPGYEVWGQTMKPLLTEMLGMK